MLSHKSWKRGRHPPLIKAQSFEVHSAQISTVAQSIIRKKGASFAAQPGYTGRNRIALPTPKLLLAPLQCTGHRSRCLDKEIPLSFGTTPPETALIYQLSKGKTQLENLRVESLAMLT